jgi:hypothetical protein
MKILILLFMFSLGVGVSRAKEPWPGYPRFPFPRHPAVYTKKDCIKIAKAGGYDDDFINSVCANVRPVPWDKQTCIAGVNCD